MLFKTISLILVIFATSIQSQETNIQILNAGETLPAQIQELNTVFMDAFSAVYSKYWDAKIEQQTKDVFANYISQFHTSPQMVLFVAKKESQVAGWALFKKLDDENAILEILCISPSFWRQGIGKKLVFSICDFCPTICHIALMTRKINPISPEFYEAMGFKKTDFCLPEYEQYENLLGFEWRKNENYEDTENKAL